MIVKVYSDSSYLSVPGARSRASGHFYLGDNIPTNQDQFEIYWMKSKFNYTDYYSKHYTAAHYKNMRPLYLASHIANKYANKKRTMSTKLSTNTICHSQQLPLATRGVLL